jgi:hypothetical protein
VDEAAEPVPAQNSHTGHVTRWMHAFDGRALLQGPVRPVRIVMIDVLAQDQRQVPFAGDQHLVQALSPGTGNPALRDRVRTRRLDRRLDYPHAGRGEHGVECSSELGVPVPDQKLRPSTRLSRFIGRVPGLLGDPLPRRMSGDAGHVHAAGAVLNEEQHV